MRSSAPTSLTVEWHTGAVVVIFKKGLQLLVYHTAPWEGLFQVAGKEGATDC